MDPLLNQLAYSVTGADDLETLTRPLLELMESVTRLESTYLTLVDEPRGVQHVLFARNARQLRIPEGLCVPWDDTLCKRALNEGCGYTSDVAERWGDSAAARELGIRTYMSQPVRMLDGALYGTLCAASASPVQQSPEIPKIMQLFATLISQQIERDRQLEALRCRNAELSTHALTDPLTGIGNRRALMLELQRALQRNRREPGGVQLAFIDLDGFKAINDCHGHEVGDGFLGHIADRLRHGIRGSDFLARYGGDEFVVLAGGTSPQELALRLERLTVSRYACGSLCLDYPGASVGVVSAGKDESDGEALIARADAAMYARKAARRALSVQRAA